MHTRVVQMFGDGHRRGGERGLGGGLITGVPREDVVVVLALAV